MPSLSDAVALIVGGEKWTGWTEVEITVGCETFPPTFSVALTPAPTAFRNNVAGQSCQIMVGSDKVIDGYVDRFTLGYSLNGGTTWRIQGRGRTQDLVDGSAQISNMQVAALPLLDFAKALCASRGVDVRLIGSAPQADVTQFNLNLGESVAAILEYVARWCGLLMYEATDGALIIAEAGADGMASGFVQGQNVQSATTNYTMDERFTDYTAVISTNDLLGQFQGTTGALTGISDGNRQATIHDDTFPARADGKKRLRPMIFTSEQVTGQRISRTSGLNGSFGAAGVGRSRYRWCAIPGATPPVNCGRRTPLRRSTCRLLAVSQKTRG